MASEERCPECEGYRGLPRPIFDGDMPRECTNQFHKEPAPIIEPEPEPPPTPAPEPPKVPAKAPVCPHCGQTGIMGTMTRIGPIDTVMVVSCAHCRKILGAFQALQIQQMMPGQLPV